MSFTSYFKNLFIATLILTLLTYFLCRLEQFASTQLFIWSSLVFFFLLSCGVYAMASRGISTANNHRFVSMITGSFTGKLLLCVVYVLVYALIVRPEGKPFFIIPFFIYYIVFTVMEVWALLKLTKQTGHKSK